MIANWFKKHRKDGLEVPDPTPIEVPLRDKPLTIHEQLARFTSNSAVMESLKNRGFDTFDEANDFDIGEADEFVSPYEAVQMAEDDDFEHVQTRLDEQKAGQVGEMPSDRYERAMERLKPKAKAPKGADAGTVSDEKKVQ